MFHMLSCFNLRQGVDIVEFCSGYQNFVDEMRLAGMVEKSGPIGQRQSNTPMDTDDERDHSYFVLMSFQDRGQVDKAYAHILKHIEPGEKTHNSVYTKVENPVFICWQDLP